MRNKTGKWFKKFNTLVMHNPGCACSGRRVDICHPGCACGKPCAIAKAPGGMRLVAEVLDV